MMNYSALMVEHIIRLIICF